MYTGHRRGRRRAARSPPGRRPARRAGRRPVRIETTWRAGSRSWGFILAAGMGHAYLGVIVSGRGVARSEPPLAWQRFRMDTGRITVRKLSLGVMVSVAAHAVLV